MQVLGGCVFLEVSPMEVPTSGVVQRKRTGLNGSKDAVPRPVAAQPLVGKTLRGHCARSETCGGSEAGSYLKPIDSCITQLKAQGPSRTCNESQEEGEESLAMADAA